jgi:cytochrome c oxidase subunit 4
MSNEHHHAAEGEYIPETYIPHSETHGTKTLWRVFFILLFITVIDFAIYFIAPAGLSRNIVFIALGLVKAVLIVGIFMHLNYEAKFLRWMIALPAAVFISYLAWLLLLEGSFVSTY